MKLKQIKFLVIALIALSLTGVAILNKNLVRAETNPVSVNMTAGDEIEDLYKAKCALCHKATAEKFFNTALKDEELIQAILKGKKAEKPPHMPEFETKGVTEEKAKLLVDYMKKLRTPPSP